MSEPSVSVSTLTPILKEGVFYQMVEFRATQAIDTKTAEKIGKVGEGLFKSALVMNGLTDFAWPPDFMDIDADPDMKGGRLRFSTRVGAGKQVVLQS